MNQYNSKWASEVSKFFMDSKNLADDNTMLLDFFPKVNREEYYKCNKSAKEMKIDIGGKFISVLYKCN